MSFWGCWGHFNGRFRRFRGSWGRLEGDVVGVLGVLGAFYGCWGRLGVFWDTTIHVRCLMKYR